MSHRDGWLAAFVLAASVAYLLACVPAPVAFSPDSQRFAFVAHGHKAADGKTPRSLYVVHRETLGVRRILQTTRPLTSPTFRSDREVIVGQIEGSAFEEFVYHRIDHESGEVSELVRSRGPAVEKSEQNGLELVHWLLRPSSSRDGQRIAVNVFVGDDPEVLVIDLEHDRVRLLPCPGFHPVITPAGDRIVFFISHPGEELPRRSRPKGLDFPRRALIDLTGIAGPKPGEEDRGDEEESATPSDEDEDTLLGVYDVDTDTVRFHPVRQLAALVGPPALDSRGTEAYVGEKSAIAAYDLKTGARRVITRTDELLRMAIDTRSRQLFFQANPVSGANRSPTALQRLNLETGGRSTLLDPRFYPAILSFGVSPDGKSLVVLFTRDDLDDPPVGTLPLVMDLESRKRRFAIPTVQDGLAVLLDWYQRGELTDEAKTLRTEIVAQLRRQIDALEPEPRARAQAMLQEILDGPKER